MAKGGKNDTDSQAFRICKRFINLMMNNFTGHAYKRLPLNSTSPISNGTNEVVIDFRHIDMPENSNTQQLSNADTDHAFMNRQKSRQHEIKVKPAGGAGITGNGPPRLTVKVEQGRGIVREGEIGRNKEKTIGKGDRQTRVDKIFKSDDELHKHPSLIDQKAEEFLRSRKEAMIRKYSSNQMH